VFRHRNRFVVPSGCRLLLPACCIVGGRGGVAVLTLRFPLPLLCVAWRGVMMQLIDQLVADGDLKAEERAKLVKQISNPHRRVFIEGAAEVYQIDKDKAELLDTLKMML